MPRLFSFARRSDQQRKADLVDNPRVTDLCKSQASNMEPSSADYITGPTLGPPKTATATDSFLDVFKLHCQSPLVLSTMPFTDNNEDVDHKQHAPSAANTSSTLSVLTKC